MNNTVVEKGRVSWKDARANEWEATTSLKLTRPLPFYLEGTSSLSLVSLNRSLPLLDHLLVTYLFSFSPLDLYAFSSCPMIDRSKCAVANDE